MRDNSESKAVSTGDQFFESGFYEDYYAWRLGDEKSKAEALNVLKLLGGKSGHILDWCGGWGRHSIHFAENGFKVTILDFLDRYLRLAKKRFAEQGLEADTICADCRTTPSSIQADYATCLMNSIGFLNEAEQLKAFQSLHGSLKDKARLVVDCMNLLALEPFIRESEKLREDGYIFRSSKRFDFSTNIEHMNFEIIDPTGHRRSKQFQQMHYTPRDLCELLGNAGFKVLDVFGSYDGNAIAFRSTKIVLLAEKR